MNTQTGELVSPSELATMDVVRKKSYIEVRRDLTAKETTDMQIRCMHHAVVAAVRNLSSAARISMSKPI